MFSTKQWMMIAAGGAMSSLLFGLVAVGSFGGVLLAYFCQLPLFIVGLSMGTAAGVIAGAIAGVSVLAWGSLLGVLIFVLFNVVPVVILVRQALLSRTNEAGDTEWYPSGLLAAWATSTALGLMALIFIWLGLTTEGIEIGVRENLGQWFEGVFQHMGVEDRAQIVDSVVPILPGMIGLSWLTMLVINGALGQGVSSRLGWSVRPNPDFALMELPRWLPAIAAALLVGAIILPGTFGYFAGNAAMIISLPFFLIGLAVVHLAAKRVSAGPLLLILFYVFMLFFGWPVVFVAFLGLIEQLAGIRQRLAPAEEEN